MQVFYIDEYQRQLQRAVNAPDVAVPGAPGPEPPIPQRPSDEGVLPAPTTAAAASTTPWWVGTALDPNGPPAGAPAPTVTDAVSYVLGQVSGLLPWLLVGLAVYFGWRFWHRRGGLAHV